MNDLKNTPLHHAVIKGDYKLVKNLLDSGADINAKNIYNITPIHEAVLYNRKKIVKLLAKYKADIEAEELYDGCTPLMIAVAYGRVHLVKLLLSFGASREHKDYDNETAFSYTIDNPKLNNAAKLRIQKLLTK